MKETHFLFLVLLIILLLYTGCESNLERQEHNKDTWWMEVV